MGHWNPPTPPPTKKKNKSKTKKSTPPHKNEIILIYYSCVSPLTGDVVSWMSVSHGGHCIVVIGTSLLLSVISAGCFMLVRKLSTKKMIMFGIYDFFYCFPGVEQRCQVMWAWSHLHISVKTALQPSIDLFRGETI